MSVFGVVSQRHTPVHQTCQQQYLVWVCMKFTMPKNVFLCVAPQIRIPAHLVCHPPWFWMAGTGVFEMHNAKKCVFSAWRPKGTYLCTKRASSSIGLFEMHNATKYVFFGAALRIRIPLHQACHQQCFSLPSIGVFEMHMHDAIYVFGRLPQTRLLLHQVCQSPCFLMASMGVFEMHNAKKCVFLAWRPYCSDLSTKYASSTVFGYPVWVYLKCIMPYSSCFWLGAPNMHMSAPNMPAAVFLDT